MKINVLGSDLTKQIFQLRDINEQSSQNIGSMFQRLA